MCRTFIVLQSPTRGSLYWLAGYMALTLLMESGWLGSAWAGAKLGAARCWRGLRGGVRARKGPAHAGGAQGVVRDEERGLLAEGTLLEDEDVRAERVALEAGALVIPCSALSTATGQVCARRPLGAGLCQSLCQVPVFHKKMLAPYTVKHSLSCLHDEWALLTCCLSSWRIVPCALTDGLLLGDLRTWYMGAAGTSPEEWQVLAEGLGKAYRRGLGEAPVQALADLWLGVDQGECFGLLGVNGAGKTTAFRVLTGAGIDAHAALETASSAMRNMLMFTSGLLQTMVSWQQYGCRQCWARVSTLLAAGTAGELRPSEGDAYVAGHSVTRATAAARQQLGYCPQVCPEYAGTYRLLCDFSTQLVNTAS